MERFHSMQAGDIFTNTEDGSEMEVVALTGSVTVKCRVLSGKKRGGILTAKVWRSVADGSARLRTEGDNALCLIVSAKCACRELSV